MAPEAVVAGEQGAGRRLGEAAVALRLEGVVEVGEIGQLVEVVLVEVVLVQVVLVQVVLVEVVEAVLPVTWLTVPGGSGRPRWPVGGVKPERSVLGVVGRRAEGDGGRFRNVPDRSVHAGLSAFGGWGVGRLSGGSELGATVALVPGVPGVVSPSRHGGDGSNGTSAAGRGCDGWSPVPPAEQRAAVAACGPLSGVGRPPHRRDERVAWRTVPTSPDALTWLALTEDRLEVGPVHDWAVQPDCGAVVVFSGTVRDHAEHRTGVTRLDYEAYEGQVEPRLAAIEAELRRRWPESGRVALLHRIGPVRLSEVSVIVAVSAPHRDEAFEAARFGIDSLKATVPIWKQEHWEGGTDWAMAATDVAAVGDLDRSGAEGSAPAGTV